MKSNTSLLFLLYALINLFILVNTDKVEDQNGPRNAKVYKCRNTGNYTSTSYKNNIKSALYVVAKNIAANNGFYHSTAGTTEPVNAVGLCPGFLRSNFCEECVNSTIPLLETNCPNQKEGVAWVKECMIRYSDRKIMGVLDDWFWVHLPALAVARRPAAEMDKALSDLITKLHTQAAGGTSAKKYATGDITYAPDITLTLVMQCTPDLSKEQCTKCLSTTKHTVRTCCSGKTTARMLSPNCYLHYDHIDFRF
ncbi:hypothetical protein Lser_V15G40373 [Lactuca serriola]